MKYVLAIGVVLAASQCPGMPQEGETETGDAPTTEKTVDAGTDAKTEVDASTIADRRVWLEPGPPPFKVPTERVALPRLGASILVPRGTSVEKTRLGLDVKFGEGKNFWLTVTEAASDLADVQARLEDETAASPELFDDAVVWNEGERWFFEQSGEFGCSNPLRARHDQRNVELMIAACRSIETTTE